MVDASWSSELTRAELTSVLAAHKLAHPGWHDLIVARRGESGRAVMLRLDSTEISAEQFRLAVGESLGRTRVPSTWFEVSRRGGPLSVSWAWVGAWSGTVPDRRG